MRGTFPQMSTSREESSQKSSEGGNSLKIACMRENFSVAAIYGQPAESPAIRMYAEQLHLQNSAMFGDASYIILS